MTNGSKSRTDPEDVFDIGPRLSRWCGQSVKNKLTLKRHITSTSSARSAPKICGPPWILTFSQRLILGELLPSRNNRHLQPAPEKHL